jgi:carboxypeptidase Taq
MEKEALYNEFVKVSEKAANLRAAMSLLAWDQETYMKTGSVHRRAKQMADLASFHHQILQLELFPLLEALMEQDFDDPIKKRNIEQSYRVVAKEVLLPENFVKAWAETTSEAQCAWQIAKANSHYPTFEPLLRKTVELARKKADYFGYKDSPYDALLDDYEPGLTKKQVQAFFEKIKVPLLAILQHIQNEQPEIDDHFLFVHYPGEKQLLFSHHLLSNLGFDSDRGRLDTSVHPFTIGLAPEDVRITTRVDENDITMSIYSTIHECGHALYEQGLNPKLYGLPISEPCSLSIHESQSRLWENNIGRSFAFWDFYFPILRSYFPQQLANVSSEQMFKAVNKVKPGLIRISADEVTYHFHIMLRFELESALIEGELSTKDLPTAWNEKIAAYLHLEVPDDAHGVLQDIHWSHGDFGYFPTYSLGSFYAAQFYYAMEKKIGSIERHLAEGNFKPILEWLQTNIFRYGRLYNSEELCMKATGEPLDVSYFLQYIISKLNRVYEMNYQPQLKKH